MFPESRITAAAFLFESAVGTSLDESEMAVVAMNGLKDADPSLLAAQIRDTLESEAELNDEYRGAAFWALGKRCDPALGDFFRCQLATEVQRDMKVAYQIMIALENLGEPVWPAGESGFSLLDEDHNREIANRYLGSLS